MNRGGDSPDLGLRTKVKEEAIILCKFYQMAAVRIRFMTNIMKIFVTFVMTQAKLVICYRSLDK